MRGPNIPMKRKNLNYITCKQEYFGWHSVIMQPGNVNPL
jgi:hypothetical protein